MSASCGIVHALIAWVGGRNARSAAPRQAEVERQLMGLCRHRGEYWVKSCDSAFGKTPRFSGAVDAHAHGIQLGRVGCATAACNTKRQLVGIHCLRQPRVGRLCRLARLRCGYWHPLGWVLTRQVLDGSLDGAQGLVDLGTEQHRGRGRGGRPWPSRPAWLGARLGRTRAPASPILISASAA